MDPYNHIEAYINNTLSPAERQQMEQAMQDDPELFQLVQQYSTIAKVAEGALEEDLLAMVERADKGTRLASTRRRWWLIALILTLAGLGIFSVWRYMEKSSRIKKAIALYERPENRDMVRSTDSENLDLLTLGKYYFELNRFEDSEEALLKLLVQTKNQDSTSQANYWLGHVYFNLQEWESSKRHFQISNEDKKNYYLDLIKKVQ